MVVLHLFPRISHQKLLQRERKKWKGIVALFDNESIPICGFTPPALSRWGDILLSSAQSPWIVWESCQSVRCKCQSCTWKFRVCVHGPEGTRAARCPWMPSSSKHREEHGVTTFIVQPVHLHFIQLWSALEFLRQVTLKNFSSFL